MKRLQFAVGMLAAVVCSSVQAQTPLRATIPFEFRMGTTSFPSGDYLVQYSSQVLMVRNEDGDRHAAMSLTLPVSRTQPPATGLLEFNRYGDSYFLAKVWIPSSTTGASLPKSARERELAKRITPSRTEAVIVATK